MASVTAEGLQALLRGLDAGQAITQGGGKFQITQTQKQVQNIVQGRTVRDASGRFAGYAPIQERAVEAVLSHLAQQVLALLEENIHKLTGEQHLSLAQLRAHGHPYGKRRYYPGIAGTPPREYVNNQSGRFANAFSYTPLQQPGGLTTLFVANETAQAGLLVSGTANRKGGVGAMIARPYDEAAVQMTRDQAGQDIEQASALLTRLGADPTKAQMPTIRYNLGGVRKTFSP